MTLNARCNEGEKVEVNLSLVGGEGMWKGVDIAKLILNLNRSDLLVSPPGRFISWEYTTDIF
jgi:hypothetical protein